MEGNGEVWRDAMRRGWFLAWGRGDVRSPTRGQRVAQLPRAARVLRESVLCAEVWQGGDKRAEQE